MFDEMLIINISVKYQLTEYDGYQTYFQELIIPGNDNRRVKFIRICEIPLLSIGRERRKRRRLR